MKSDLEQLKAGAAPKPIPPAPPVGGLPGLKAEPSKPSLPAGKPGLPAPKKGISKLLIIGGVVIFGIAIGLAGYFFIFPMLFPPEAPTPPTTTTPATPSAQPTAPTVPTLPNLPTAPAAKPHQSFLKTPADSEAPIFVPDISMLSQALADESQTPAPAGVLKEVLLSDPSGQVNFSDVLPALLSGFTKTELSNLFEGDFTALLYYDTDGVWPAYVAKLKAGASLANAKTLMAKLETAAISNLYLSSPGTPTGFKSGQVSGVQTRYQTFSQKGASFNYGWSGDKLIISASYNGLKKVLGNL